MTFKDVKKLGLTIAIPILLILGAVTVLLPCMGIGSVNAQTFDKVIRFPDVNVTNSNNQNSSLSEEFLLVANTPGNNNSQFQLEVLNPSFGLSQPFVKLIEGQKYIVDPLNDADIKYANITVKLAQVLFVSPDVKIQESNPESPDEMTLGTPITLGNYAPGTSGFIIPSNLPPGNYILYVYLQYPEGITGVFSNLATVAGSNNNDVPSGSNGQGPDFRPICNTLQIALYHSCGELVTPDGSLTPLGQDTVKCPLTGAISGLGGIGIFHLPPGMVINGLNFLAGQTGCGGLVKLDLLSSIGNINGVLNQLTRFIH